MSGYVDPEQSGGALQDIADLYSDEEEDEESSEAGGRGYGWSERGDGAECVRDQLKFLLEAFQSGDVAQGTRMLTAATLKSPSFTTAECCYTKEVTLKLIEIVCSESSYPGELP